MSEKSCSSIFEELKRRSVFRAAAAYLVVAWILIQVADTIFPYIGLGERTVTFLIVFLAIGFIVTLIVSWAYEMTPDGLRRDEKVERPETARRRQGLRAFDYAIAVILTAIIAVYTFNRITQPSVPSAMAAGSSIAVLPFDNRSATPEDAYFVDGIHDDILTSLQKIAAFEKIISRTTVERYRETDKTVPEIGAELGVAAILEGGVQRAGGMIRVNVQLIEAATDNHLWAENFDKELTAENVFAIQSEIATTIATALSAVVSPEEETRLARMPTKSLAAYEAYLLGNQRIQRRTGKALEQAVDYFQQAIDLDPQFALAWVGLADSYKLLDIYGGWSRSETQRPAMDAAQEAIDLDPNLGEAYASLAVSHHEYRTGVDPEPLFRQAVLLNPNYAPGRQWYADFLGVNGRIQEAQVQYERALELDPLSPIVNVQFGVFYLNTGRLDEARIRYLRSIEIDPQFARGYQGLANYYRQVGRWGHALVAIDEAYRLNPSQPSLLLAKVGPLTQLGDYVGTENVIEQVATIDPQVDLEFAKIQLYFSRGGEEAAVAARQHWDRENIRGWNKTILTNHYLRTDRIDEAIELLETVTGTYALPSAPETSAMHRGDGITAIQYAYVLKRAGRDAAAETWIAPLLDFYGKHSTALETVDKPTQNQLYNLVNLAQVHVVNDDNAQALSLLRQAVDAGWSIWGLYTFDDDPIFDELRDQPEFQSMRETVRARMAEQLRAYRAGEITLP
jgi:TolB-like protein